MTVSYNGPRRVDRAFIVVVPEAKLLAQEVKS
jgi:hypothetical protein